MWQTAPRAPGPTSMQRKAPADSRFTTHRGTHTRQASALQGGGTPSRTLRDMGGCVHVRGQTVRHDTEARTVIEAIKPRGLARACGRACKLLRAAPEPVVGQHVREREASIEKGEVAGVVSRPGADELCIVDAEDEVIRSVSQRSREAVLQAALQMVGKMACWVTRKEAHRASVP